MRIHTGSAKSLAFRFKVRLNQQLWKGKISRPFLSPDLFVSLCDFAYLEKVKLDEITESQLRKAKSVFCKSDLLEEFLQNYSDSISATILICGNSDRDFTEIPSDLPESVKALFLQNSFVSNNSTIFTLPIGLENLSLGINGNPKYLRTKRVQVADSRKILAGPYSLTHFCRENFLSKYPESKGDLIVIKKTLFPKDYSKLVSRFKFVLALRGNGVDTHRFWETLYRGAVPIVQASAWSRSVAELGLPFIEVKDLQYETIEEGVRIWGSREIDPLEIEQLWEDFWINLFNTLIKDHERRGQWL